MYWFEPDGFPSGPRSACVNRPCARFTSSQNAPASYGHLTGWSPEACVNFFFSPRDLKHMKAKG